MTYYSHLKCVSSTNIKIELDSTLEEPAVSFTIVKCSVVDFKPDHTICKDGHRSDRTNEVTRNAKENKQNGIGSPSTESRRASRHGKHFAY